MAERTTLMNLKQTILNAETLNQEWAGIPGIEITPRGRIFVTCFSGGPHEPDPANTIYLSSSDDDGQTFSPPCIMAIPRDGARAFDPTLWRDPLGRLWLIFNRGNKDNADHGICARLCADPDAIEPVWTEERCLDLAVPYAFRMNKPIVLASGVWVLPVTHASEPIQSWFAGPKQRQGVAIAHDAGESWTLHGSIEAPDWALENMVVERKDGSLWMLIRTGAGELWQSVSTDGGRSWSAGRPSGIRNPGSRFFIRRLASGNLLLINHAGYAETGRAFTGRSHLTAQISTDDGLSWSRGLLFDERDGVSYPDAVEAADGVIRTVYDRDRGGAGEILLATFREADVIAGTAGGAARKPGSAMPDPPGLLSAGWNPVVAADRVLAGLVKVTTPQAKGAHDAEFVCVGKHAYIVEHDNDVEPGHGAGKAMYCVLSIVDLETLAVEKTHLLAKAGQVFTNATLPDAETFVPRIVRKDANTLRCFFASQPGAGPVLTWYRDFDLSDGTFADTIHKARIKTRAGVFDMEPRHLHADAAVDGFSKPVINYGMYIFDSSTHITA